MTDRKAVEAVAEWVHEKAREVASDIDALLHAGQRSEARYSKIVPVIERALEDAGTTQAAINAHLEYMIENVSDYAETRAASMLEISHEEAIRAYLKNQLEDE